MAQRTDGLLSLLGAPRVYGVVQGLIGTTRSRRLLANEYLNLTPDTRLLDVGCANGRFLDMLPPLHYVGFDPDPGYITAAKHTYGARGRFLVGTIDTIDVEQLGEFDSVVARGVLHHLDDDEVERLAKLAVEVLTPEGVFVSLDPCRCAPQRRLARFFADRDRGRNVRTAIGYRDLVGTAFSSVDVHEHHDLLRVPYDHAVIVARAR